jgi:hypothetical protein
VTATRSGGPGRLLTWGSGLPPERTQENGPDVLAWTHGSKDQDRRNREPFWEPGRTVDLLRPTDAHGAPDWNSGRKGRAVGPARTPGRDLPIRRSHPDDARLPFMLLVPED